MDRFLAQLSVENKVSPNHTSLACVSLLIAAKLEEPISPSFKKMIKLLPIDLQAETTKPELLKLEKFVITTLQFNLQWVGPLVYIDRLI